MTALIAGDNASVNPMSFTDPHGSVVLERLRYQRDTGRFCDVAILVKDKQFCAHRTILAACSPYFESIFKSTKVTVNCTNPFAFELLLNYMYSGCIVIDRTTVFDLLKLSNNFLITKLKNYCSEYLDRYLDAANCLSVSHLANRYNLPTLIKAAAQYFDINLNRCLLESTDIINYTYPQLVNLLTDQKYCDVITSDTHLKLIVRWVGEDLPQREMLFRQLLHACPVARVSEDTLDFLLDYSPLFSKSQACRYLLLHAMNDCGMMVEKYESQFVTLRQQIGELPPLEPICFDDDDSSEEEDDEFEAPVDGKPTTTQILEEGDPDRPKLKLKICLGSADLKRRFKKVSVPGRRRGRPPTKIRENESIPMLDDDNLDGVYATNTVDNVIMYGPEDRLDPEDVDDGEDVLEENGQLMCTYCRFATNSEEALEKHQARQHNRNTYFMCQVCEYESNWSKAFYEHCMEHWTEAPYQCDRCPYVCETSIHEFLSHRVKHSKERFFKCGECAWRGRSRTQLWAHERMHSILDERPLHCEECGRGYRLQTALDLHVASHNELRPYVCEECGFASKSLDDVTVHKRQHSGDMFLCHVDGCDYTATKKSQLAAHLRTHMAVRAHMCHVCGRGFIEKSHLIRHERIHLEDKPFKCDACDYASSRRDKLKEHILKHHNGTASLKLQRRRYKRAKQLAAINANMSRPIVPDAMFRPIPTNDAVTRWQQANDFDSYQSKIDYQLNQMQPAPPSGHQMGPPMDFNPPRAFSVVDSGHHHVAPISPGSMSLMNVHLHGADTPMMVEKGHLGPAQSTLVTPTPRSPHNRSADPFGLQPQSDMHRPLSLPVYGQMGNQMTVDMQNQQQQQQQQMQQMQEYQQYQDQQQQQPTDPNADWW